jgi:hypothetical protein
LGNELSTGGLLLSNHDSAQHGSLPHLSKTTCICMHVHLTNVVSLILTGQCSVICKRYSKTLSDIYLSNATSSHSLQSMVYNKLGGSSPEC